MSELVVGVTLVPVPGPVTPEVTETSLAALVVASEDVDTTAVLALAVDDPVSLLEASLVGVAETSEVVTDAVTEVSSVLETSIVVVADTCEVTPVPEPVAVESIVLEVVAGNKLLVTSETTLLTPEATLLTSSDSVLSTELRMPVADAVVVMVEEPDSVALSLSEALVVVASTDEVLSVEETMIPLDVWDTAVLDGLVVVEDGVTMP